MGIINYIWIGLIVISFLFAAINGKMAEITLAAIDYAKTGVEISIGLVGIMALWLGIMRVGEKAGLINLISKLIFPVLKKLFPGVPGDHPALGSVVMNLSANMLGLNNAATPLGLKAMEELQKLNKVKDRATDAMVMFLALNTSSVQLIPASVIAILIAAGATNPTDIIITALLATTASTFTAIVAVKLLGRFNRESSHD